MMHVTYRGPEYRQVAHPVGNSRGENGRHEVCRKSIQPRQEQSNI